MVYKQAAPKNQITNVTRNAGATGSIIDPECRWDIHANETIGFMPATARVTRIQSDGHGKKPLSTPPPSIVSN
jgi:hypothetical protein